MRLGGKVPRQKPRIEFRFLEDAQDADALVDGLRKIRRLASKKAPAEAIQRELAPGKKVTSDDDLHAYARRHVEGYSHLVGTCKMGPRADAGAVVDADGRVRGVDNVFVADASTMPVIPRANTNMTCMLIGRTLGDGESVTTHIRQTSSAKLRSPHRSSRETAHPGTRPAARPALRAQANTGNSTTRDILPTTNAAQH